MRSLRPKIPGPSNHACPGRLAQSGNRRQAFAGMEAAPPERARPGAQLGLRPTPDKRLSNQRLAAHQSEQARAVSAKPPRTRLLGPRRAGNAVGRAEENGTANPA